MTLALYGIVGGFVVQTCDRRLSIDKRGTFVPYDDSSNKSLIYEDSDASALLSYTGCAFIGSTPTDHFVAEALVGHELDESVHMQLGARDAGDLNHAAVRLTTALNRAADAGQIAAGGLCVALVGWRGKHDSHLTPFCWAVAPDPVTGRFRVRTRLLPRSWRWDKLPWLYSFPSHGRAFTSSVAAKTVSSITEITDVLVVASRELAARCNTVGHDLQVVVLNAKTGFVHCRSDTDGDKSFTPWAITRGGILHPSEIQFSVVMEVGDLTIHLDAGEDIHGRNRAEARKPPPRPRGGPV